MKRDIYKDLLAWKNSVHRKPLVLRGARQTGKTFVLKEFGKTEYRRMFYFNFEEDPSLMELFERDLKPARILRLLSTYMGEEIHPHVDLIVFDEIQASNNALNALKYFQEEANEYHIATAGSLLGVRMSAPKSFPVGKVNLMPMHPMTFAEFMDALDENRYRRLLEDIDRLDSLPEVLHRDLQALLLTYYLVGGMPEAVGRFIGGGTLKDVRVIQQDILNSYALDFAKHADAVTIPKLSHVWESIPTQLTRENKKFTFSAIKKSARARDYEAAVKWLEDAGLILRAFACSEGKHPLKGYVDRRSFKVYALDVGLLGAMLNVPVETMAGNDRLFDEYRGAFVENYVAQQLASHVRIDLYYWKRSGKQAELDFLFPFEDRVFPLEVKAGINPRSKSLKSYDQQFNPSLLLRATLLNLKFNGKILNIPLYGVMSILRFIRMAEGALEV